MSRPARVSPRSFLIAGMSAAVVGAGAVTPVSPPAPSPARMTSAVELTSIASGLQGVADGIGGIFANLNSFSAGIQATIDHILSLPDGVQTSIKKAYNTAEAWPAYAAAWAQFSLGLIPGLWWVAPSIPLAYNTVEPLVRAGVYSTADLVGLDPGQFASDIRDGIKTSSDNAARYRQAWAASFVAVPTLPPYPGPLPGTNPAAALPAAAAAAVAAPQTAATGGIENAIKNTYNAVEPWVAWGFQLVQWGMGFVPGLWWVAPGVSLAYYSIEPLVQAGVYTVADVLGLNFAQIGPDIKMGIQQSVQNFVSYGLAWLQSLVPFPPLPPFPPRHGAVVAAPSAVRAAAAVASSDTAVTEATVTEATTDTAPAGHEGAVGENAGHDSAPAADISAPARDQGAAPIRSAPPATETPATGDATPSAQAVAEPEVQAPATGDAPAADALKPSRGAHLGHRSPAADSGAKTPAAGAKSGRTAG
jgi:hypothetical protein